MDYYGKIENPEGLPNGMNNVITTKLISGKEISFPIWLQGGGQVQKKYFLKYIGNKKYKNAFEWCAGHGEIGFELITAGVCETLAFSDMHPASSEWCLKNAESLGLSDKISAYNSSTIAGLPQTVKWDLVVGNPPNSINEDPQVLEWAKLKGLSDDHLLLYARTTWDFNFQTHIEFFENIINYITPDADIFLSVHDSVIAFATEHTKKHFDIIEIFDMFPDPYPEFQPHDTSTPTDSQLKIVHYRQKVDKEN